MIKKMGAMMLGVMFMLAAVGFRAEAANDPVICSLCECLSSVPYFVDCMNTDMTEVPPMTRDNFTTPWQLDFGNNRITTVPQFPVMPNLVKLSLKRNFISTLSNEAFTNLPDLQVLSLQFNNLTEESLREEVFRGKQNVTHYESLPIQELDLGYNHLKTLESHTLHHLTLLKKLFLANNPLKDISWAMATAITQLRNLEELDLSQTDISRLPSHFLSDLTKLRVLTLAGNQFTTIPEEVNFVHNLQHLNLNANPIKTIMVDDFSDRMSGLRELELSAMPLLRIVGKQAFSNLLRLEVLRMADNPILAIIDPEAFYVLQGNELALQELHLQGNALTTIHETLVPWLDLSYVDLQDNPWNCDCNLKWLPEILIPDLENKNPETTLSIMCNQPIADRGMKMAELLSHAHTFECSAPHPFVQEPGKSGPIIVATIVIGVMLLLTGTLIFTYVLYRRTRDRQVFGERVKYRRAHNEEEEATAAAQTVNG